MNLELSCCVQTLKIIDYTAKYGPILKIEHRWLYFTMVKWNLNFSVTLYTFAILACGVPDNLPSVSRIVGMNYYCILMIHITTVNISLDYVKVALYVSLNHMDNGAIDNGHLGRCRTNLSEGKNHEVQFNTHLI